ncbi:hypothetical protein TPA0907_10690 [Micromonospora humidisoli]|uniref:hypothetical protein n=1 Tax=Micromonospora sp. AKA109 TaxID=2733865 RepID=UPI0022C40298|nr:hypothetical protein TPA0907_10690 [Micromonospora sp. AKA109]
MIELRSGVLVQVTRKASPQFVRPILFRLIRVRTEWITYDGWAWLDGYQIDAKGDAVARRSIYVQPAGLLPPEPAPTRQPVPASRAATSRRASSTRPHARVIQGDKVVDELP